MKQIAPLSKVQYGIYVECVNHVGEICYNLPYLYTLDPSLDPERLAAAIRQAVMAHPTLFTRIKLTPEGEPVQVIDMEHETWDIAVEDITDIEQTIGQLVKPYDIYGDRLFRIHLLRDALHLYLFIDYHHLIVDGTSMSLMLHDIDSAYAGKPLAPEAVTLADIARQEEEDRKSPAFDEARTWYAQHFDCGDTYTPLLPDREGTESEEGQLLRTLGIDMEHVDAFCKRSGIYRSTLFTMAYAYLLAKYNNDQESLFDTVYNGRKSKDLGRTVGMMVKTLPVYAKFTAETSVLEYLQAGQEQLGGSRKHDIYSYMDIAQDLKLQSASLFAWHGMLFSDEQLCGQPMRARRIGNSTLEAPLYLKAFILGGKYQVKAEYKANQYSEALIAALLESYEAVVEGMLGKERLCDIRLTTRSQLSTLDSFNQTDVDYDNTQTLVSLFERQAQATPDAVAVVYDGKQYTYAEVNELSDHIAADITARGLGREDVVSVLIPRCEWMSIVSLGVLKAGCAYQPLDPTYPKERLNFMMGDACARLLIADEELRPIVDEYQGDVLLTKDIAQLTGKADPSRHPSPDSLMILLYTSGSTGVPKGCQLTHSNLVAFCTWYQRYYHLGSDNRVAAYASYGFDACMMDMYPTLTCGATLHIIPEEIRLDLVALNEYFERNQITHSFMTTQVGYQFATSVENHSLLHLSTGGEKLASLTPPEGYQFYNAYGPTECTIFTTVYPVREKLNDIPIGKPVDNMHLYVVDGQGRRLPVGAAGELWASGPQVSRGYLNRPEKTAEVYIANPFASEEKYSRIYRTGDIVRYLPDGNIQFVGRRDGQVKIRGFRIELKEVESVIREFPGIKDATVQAFDEEGGGKYIAAYIVSPSTIDIEALNQFILDRKPPYMVPAVTMQIDAIPLNQNQKVNRRALPVPERKAMTADTGVQAPMNVLEEELHQLISDIVKTSDFGITTLLAYVGLTSISSIKLAVQINKRYGVALDAKSLAKTATLQSIENEILRHLMSGEATPAQAAAPTQEREQLTTATLSYAQTGVYFDCLKNPTSTIYNIPYLLTFPADTDAELLAKSVKQVVELHPELHVRFTTQGDSIVQTLDGQVNIEVPIVEMTAEQLVTYKNDFVQPFNLQKAPLCRFEVVKSEAGVGLLMDVHHLVFDGGSADLFIRQLCEAYEGGKLEPETYTYLDYVADQQKAADSETMRASEQFFAQQLSTCEGASEVPADLPKSDQQGWIGEAVCQPDFDRANAFCRSQGITPAHLFLAATSYVVARHTNNRDVYLCTVSSGRSNLKIADTVGMFVGTLALGVHIEDVSVGDFLHAASQTFEQTLQHEDYPFARIATDYGFRPSIAYAYQVGVLSEYTVCGKAIGQELLELKVPKFKLNIKIEQRGVVVQYDDSLYSPQLAESIAESIVAVAHRMMESPEAKVRQLSIVSQNQEKELGRLRQTATADAPLPLFHLCIPHFAALQPDHEALVAIDARYTYREMDELTNRMARELRRRGVGERERVALLLPRTSRLILSLFSVLKAGAAYIPCDPEYPADRIRLILDDSEARYIITTADRLDTVPSDKAIDVEDLVGSTCSCEPVETTITGDDLAYLIYTSGSTGRPKGVMLRHEGITNYLYGHPANVFANGVLTDARRMLSVTTISFDAALQDIGMAYYNGKTLVLATEQQANNPLDLARLIREQEINMVSGTPSRWLTSRLA